MNGHAQPPELDLDVGAQRLGTDRKQLEALLPTYLKDHEDIPRRVREAQERGDYQAIRGWAHKVLGAYFIGADELRARADEVDDEIADKGIASAEEIEAFCNQLQVTLDAIRRMLQ